LAIAGQRPLSWSTLETNKPKLESKLRVLVVDDEPRITRFVRLSLTSQGFEVLVASSGEEGLEMAAAEKPDLMILDIFMPGIDGFGVLQKLRASADHNCSHMPVIVFSARASVAEEAIKLGATDFISKPFVPEEMAEKIRTAIAESR
jgi:DNA-binding response OmpR family regulator